MNKYALDLSLPGDLFVRLYSSRYELMTDEAKLLYGAYLPGVGFPEPIVGPAWLLDRIRPTFTVSFEESSRSSINWKRAKIEVSDRWRAHGSILDVAHIIYCFARKHWLKQGLYPVHAACVSTVNGGATLLVGHSGVGKTTIAMDLALKHGRQIFSGNKTLVSFDKYSRVLGEAGTRTMTTRGEDGAPAQTPGALDYVGRKAAPLDERLQPLHNHVIMQEIVIARLNGGRNEVKSLAGADAQRSLYPYFMDYVNGDTIICGGAHVLYNEPPSGAREKLAAGLRWALPHIKVRAVSGELDFVVARVAQL